MVRGAEFAIGNARGLADQFDVETRIGNIRLELFHCPGRQKAGGRRYKGNSAAIGKARADTHHGLFGDADIDQALWKFLLKTTEIGGADRIIDDDDDTLIFCSQRFDGLGPCLATINQWSRCCCSDCH